MVEERKGWDIHAYTNNLPSPTKPKTQTQPSHPTILLTLTFPYPRITACRFYFVYHFMLLVYLILLVVAVCTTVVAVYFVLNAENYHWQVRRSLSSGLCLHNSRAHIHWRSSQAFHVPVFNSAVKTRTPQPLLTTLPFQHITNQQTPTHPT